jgi:hypothetical protein
MSKEEQPTHQDKMLANSTKHLLHALAKAEDLNLHVIEKGDADAGELLRKIQSHILDSLCCINGRPHMLP